MAYMDNKARGRENPASDSIMDDAGAQAGRSNQERQQSQTSKFRNVSTAPKANVGNQVRVQSNNKGTGVVGRPSSVGVQGKDFVQAAVENPDGQASRSVKGSGVTAKKS